MPRLDIDGKGAIAFASAIFHQPGVGNEVVMILVVYLDVDHATAIVFGPTIALYDAEQTPIVLEVVQIGVDSQTLVRKQIANCCGSGNHQQDNIRGHAIS